MGNDEFVSGLERASEVDLTVVGRRSGRESTRPVWFVREDRRVYLVPIYGTDSAWYKNVLDTPAVRLDVAGRELAASATPVIDADRLAAVVDAFKAKYGDASFERHYPHPNAAVEIALE